MYIKIAFLNCCLSLWIRGHKIKWLYARIKKNPYVCETLYPGWQQNLKKLFLAQRSKSRSQGHWPWCLFNGHHCWSMHAKYEVSISYALQVIMKVKVDFFLLLGPEVVFQYVYGLWFLAIVLNNNTAASFNFSFFFEVTKARPFTKFLIVINLKPRRWNI